MNTPKLRGSTEWIPFWVPADPAVSKIKIRLCLILIEYFASSAAIRCLALLNFSSSAITGSYSLNVWKRSTEYFHYCCHGFLLDDSGIKFRSMMVATASLRSGSCCSIICNSCFLPLTEVRLPEISTNNLPRPRATGVIAVNSARTILVEFHGVGHHLLVPDWYVHMFFWSLASGTGNSSDGPVLDNVKYIISQAPFNILRATGSVLRSFCLCAQAVQSVHHSVLVDSVVRVL